MAIFDSVITVLLLSCNNFSVHKASEKYSNDPKIIVPIHSGECEFLGLFSVWSCL